MNSQNSVNPNLSQNQENDDIDLFGILDTTLKSKWLILSITIVVLTVSVAYAFLSTPIYQANSLIQVESNQNNANSTLSEINSLFNVDSPATAEIEILKSRLVIGRAVDSLKLYISAEPNYLPLIGRWLSKISTDLSNPGIFGFGGYVTGTESIKISTLDVPKSLEGKKITLLKTKDGYTLKDPDGNILTVAIVGKLTTFEYNGESGKILVDNLEGKPGAQFNLIRSSRLNQIIRIQQLLNITEKGKQSGMLFATLSDSDPSRASTILNAIGTAYVNQNIERKSAEAEKSLEFLDDFLPQLKEQMQQSEEKYTHFRDLHGTFDLGTEGKLSLQSSIDLQTKLLELQQKRRELEPRFTSSHPAIKTIDEQISAINRAMGQIENNVKKMPDLEQQLLSLMRNVQVNSEMYVNLLNSAQQLRLVKAGKVGNVRVVDYAAVPEIPVAPQRGLIISVGALLGLILGVMSAFLKSWLRPGLTQPTEIESRLGLNVFATIPHSNLQEKLHRSAADRHQGLHVLAERSAQDPAVESLRGLRTALQFAMLEAPNNIILITGPTPSIGKSFITVNFAAVLASTQKRVLLIDGDLRKGYINQYFSLERRGGLSELISGSISIEKAIHTNILNNLDLLTTGELPPNPAELLSSSSARELLSNLSKNYDLVVIDSAPVLAVSDALSLAPQAGILFLLARAGTTTLGEIDETYKRLKQVGSNVTGVVFNDLVQSAHRYGSRYSPYQYANYEYGIQNQTNH